MKTFTNINIDKQHYHGNLTSICGVGRIVCSTMAMIQNGHKIFNSIDVTADRSVQKTDRLHHDKTFKLIVWCENAFTYHAYPGLIEIII